MAVTIRSADLGSDLGRADVEACRAIYATYVETTAISLEDDPPDLEEMRRRMATCLASHAWLVAEDDDGTVIGYAYGGPHRPRAGYRFTTEVSVYVAPGHQGRGLGRALYEPLLATLHESLGFTRVATFPGVGWKLGAWHDTGWWALPLSDDPSQSPSHVPSQFPGEDRAAP